MKRLQEHNLNTKEYWDSVYKYGGDENIARLNQVKFLNLASYIEDWSRVIDLGCGDGNLCKVILAAKRNCQITGLDFSKRMIYELDKDYPTINFISGDVTNTGLKSEFDYVITTEVLEHLDKPQELIDESYRLLKKGGKFILTTPYKDHVPSREHVFEFDYKDVEKMLEQFSESWVFPWASGWSQVKNVNDSMKYQAGHWDIIMALAIK